MRYNKIQDTHKMYNPSLPKKNRRASTTDIIKLENRSSASNSKKKKFFIFFNKSIYNIRNYDDLFSCDTWLSVLLDPPLNEFFQLPIWPSYWRGLSHMRIDVWCRYHPWQCSPVPTPGNICCSPSSSPPCSQQTPWWRTSWPWFFKVWGRRIESGSKLSSLASILLSDLGEGVTFELVAEAGAGLSSSSLKLLVWSLQ